MTKTTTVPTCPFAASRRGFLLGAGAIAAGGAMAPAMAADSAPQVPAPRVADAPIAGEQARGRVPFYGLHQAGVVTPRPASGMVAAFDVVANSSDDLRALLKKLTERIAFLTQGGPIPERDPKLTPPD